MSDIDTTIALQAKEIMRLRADNASLRAALQHAPLEPGSFVGDIFYGNPDYTTLGTHKWDGSQWVALPSVEESLTTLLAETRADNKRLRAALREIAKYEIEDGCPCSACQHSALARAALEDRT